MEADFKRPAKPFEFSFPSDWDLGPVRLQGPQEFYHDLLDLVWNAKKSVWIRTMLYLPGRDYVPGITEELKAARIDRRIPVAVIVDGVSQAYRRQTGEVDWALRKLVTFLKGGETPSEKMIEESFIRRNNEQMEELKKAGVTLLIFPRLRGIKKLYPWLKIDHNKLFMVDGKIAWGTGGLGNIFDPCFNWIDFICKTEDSELVDAIGDLFFSSIKGNWYKNYQDSPLPDYQFLVDAGTGKSLIYDRAVEIVEDAKSKVHFVSQFLPDGKLLAAMEDQSRHGLEVVVYTSGPEDYVFQKLPYRWAVRHSLQAIRKSDIELRRSKPPYRVHAKGISNENTVLVGSHNLSRISQWARAKENAFYSTDPRLRQQFKHFLDSIPLYDATSPNRLST